MDVLPSGTTPGSFRASVNDMNGAPWSPAAIALATPSHPFAWDDTMNAQEKYKKIKEHNEILVDLENKFMLE